VSLRSFGYFTAATLAACVLLICFLDQPLALFIHRHTGGAVPFFLAYTEGADHFYGWLLNWRLGPLPWPYVLVVAAYVVGRWGLRRPGASLFLVVLLVHIASQVSSNVLKGVVHRLRPEVLFGAGYEGLGLWASGPHNDSFPSSHTAGYLSLFWPLAVAWPRYRLPLLVLPGLIMLGRPILGAHYMSDVWFSVWLVVAWTTVFGGLLAWIDQRAANQKPLANQG